MNVVQYIEQVAERFQQAELCYGHGTDNPLDEAVYLVCASLALDFQDCAAMQKHVLSNAETELLEQRVRARIEWREPVAYLTGQAWFAGHRFHADRRALIPRSPMGELINNRCVPLLQEDPACILDLCCGGGCIGIAAALEFVAAQVVLADISTDALALAQSNTALHAVQGRVTAVQSDLFGSLHGKFDLILCNPPYVSQAEVESLPAEYAREPVLGLLSDDDGLDIPLRILRQADKFLADNGLLIMEVGYSHLALSDRLRDVPLLWLEFENGGEGVLAITASELRQYKARFV